MSFSLLLSPPSRADGVWILQKPPEAFMKHADHTPEHNTLGEPIPDQVADESSELDDVDLDSVAGGTTWHLPEDPVTTPWDEGVDL